MNRVLLLVKNLIIVIFSIAQTQENQMRYIRDRRILELLERKKENHIKWS